MRRPRPRRVGNARVAIAAGPAFSFVYQDNLEALEAAGAELLPFDPRHDPACPTDRPRCTPEADFPRSS